MTKEELKLAREKLNLTQTALAEKIGVQWRQVCRWEAGDAPIRLSIVLSIKYLLLIHNKKIIEKSIKQLLTTKS